MKHLQIADVLNIPIDVVTEKLAWIGVTGSGKSYGASKLAELLWEAHAQFVVLDPVGVWYGLRLAKDGKGAGISIPVFGGLHGDVPLEPTGGALVADLIVDRDLSVVLDVSQFDSDAQKARFVSDFAERLFQRKKASPSAVHVFLEEAQEFVPQNPQRGEEMMLHRLHRLQKLGRNFGIGTSVITQRPQETSKKALNQAQTVFAFRLTGSQERKAVELWIEDKGLDQDLVAALPKIQTGHCHVWSPAWLKISKMVHIAPKHTYDASATPKVGEARATRELAPIDLERIRTAMAATIEKAKADDPKELRANIAMLRKLLADAQSGSKETKIERVEVPVLKEADIKRLEAVMDRAYKTQEASVAVLRSIHGTLDHYRAQPAPMASVRAMEEKWRAEIKHVGFPVRRTEEIMVLNGAVRVGPSHQRVINTMAWLYQLGILEPSRAQTAVLSGMTPNGGYYARIVGELKTAGLVAYPAGGTLLLTDAGRAQANPGKSLQTNEAIQADVLARLGPSHRRVLEALIGAYPQALPRPNAAAAAQMDAAGGYFSRLTGELKTMGVITYPDKGQLRAAEILFVRVDVR